MNTNNNTQGSRAESFEKFSNRKGKGKGDKRFEFTSSDYRGGRGRKKAIMDRAKSSYFNTEEE